MRTILYRVAIDALDNVRKHAHASHAVVTVEDRDGGVLVRVTDDGVGFSAEAVDAAVPKHVGLASMRERAAVAGGWCRIETAPGQGTAVQVWLPAAGPARSLAS